MDEKPLENGIGNALELREMARSMGLDLGSAETMADDRLLREYNGIGPDRWDPERRIALSGKYRQFLPAVLVHDADFANGGNRRQLIVANERLRNNLRKIIDTMPVMNRIKYRSLLPATMMMVSKMSAPGWRDANAKREARAIGDGKVNYTELVEKRDAERDAMEAEKAAAYLEGFLSKYAEYGLVKKADPPNRGLNDPNPVKRHVYKTYGYVPQASRSYLSPAGGDPLYDKMIDNAQSFMEKQPWYNDDTPTPEQRAAWFDLSRAAGNMGSYYSQKLRGRPYVVLGSYPASEYTLRHELGHHKDDMSRPSGWDMQNDDTLPKEERAWDLAGIPAGNSVREAWLNTYRYKPTAWGSAEAAKQVMADMNRLYDTANAEEAKVYRRPDTYVSGYGSYGIPIIHDYRSALDAARNGYEF